MKTMKYIEYNPNMGLLIDVRDNVNEPINYYIVTPHQKCEFFVVNKDSLYLYIVKNADLENE